MPYLIRLWFDGRQWCAALTSRPDDVAYADSPGAAVDELLAWIRPGD